MNYGALFRSALVALLRNKMRSILTVLGITIGIAAVAPFAAMVGRAAAASNDDVDPAGDKLGGQGRTPIKMPLGPPVFDQHVLALSIAVLAQALAERGDKVASRTGRPAVEEADHRRLLPVRGARPRERSHYCRAAEKGDDLAPSHVRHAPSSPAWYRHRS